MRRTLITVALTLAALVALAPAAIAKPDDDGVKSEHGVNRAKLVKKAEKIVEERNGITVTRIASCGPVKTNGRPNYSKWICGWRAEGFYPGEVAVRLRRQGALEAQEQHLDRRQVREPAPARGAAARRPEPSAASSASTTTGSASPTQALQHARGHRARRSHAPAFPGAASRPSRASSTGPGPDRAVRQAAQPRRPPAVGADRRPLLGAGQHAGLPCRQGRPPPGHRPLRRVRRLRRQAAKRYPESIGFEVWNEPNYPLYWGGPPEPNDYAKMLKTVGGAIHQDAPGTTVVSAGLSPHSDNDNSGSIGFRDFLISMFENGAVARRPTRSASTRIPGVGPSEDYVGDVRVYLGKIQNVLARYNAVVKAALGDGVRRLDRRRHSLQPRISRRRR